MDHQGASDAHVGSVAEETERLLRALRSPQESARGSDQRAGGQTRTARGSRASGDSHSDCGWCPICRGVAWVRSADEQTIDKLVQGASMVASALVELATQARTPAPTSGPNSAASDAATAGPTEGDTTTAAADALKHHQRTKGAS